MFALATARSSRVLQTVIPRAVVAASSPSVTGRVSLSIGEKLQGKEKTEEDRYIREQEKKFFEKKKAELEKHIHEKELTEFKDTIAPKMAELHVLLKKTGDTVSDAGLEALARWKLEK